MLVVGVFFFFFFSLFLFLTLVTRPLFGGIDDLGFACV